MNENSTYSKCMRIGALFILSLAMIGPIFVYFASLNSFALWIFLWLGVWALFLFLPLSLEARGFIFLVGSLLVSIIGAPYLKKLYASDDFWLIELFSQFMIIVGGGVGANFIATGMLKFEERTQKNKL